MAVQVAGQRIDQGGVTGWRKERELNIEPLCVWKQDKAQQAVGDVNFKGTEEDSESLRGSMESGKDEDQLTASFIWVGGHAPDNDPGNRNAPEPPYEPLETTRVATTYEYDLLTYITTCRVR